MVTMPPLTRLGEFGNALMIYLCPIRAERASKNYIPSGDYRVRNSPWCEQREQNQVGRLQP